ncbi:MAG: tetratricopeptide repeat protein [Alphaproteobacteria bacterium]|nr:tetratricopeptide repeat protein [Alphaproteobacteria bacterium]
MNIETDTETALNAAVQHLQTGNLGAAEATCRSILDHTPEQFAALNLLGAIAMHSGEPDAALELFQKSTVANPAFFDAHLNLGNTLRAVGDLNGAGDAFLSCLSIQPDDALLHLSLGAVQMEQGLAEEAATAFRKAVALAPDDADAHCSLGNALMVSGDLVLAVESFRAALARAPRHEEALTNLGLTLIELGQLEEAAATLRSVVTLTPDVAEAHNNLGVVLRRQRHLEDALATFQTAHRLQPDLIEAHNNIGQTLFELDDVDGAIATFRESLATHPNDVGTLINLAGIGERANRLDVALPAIKQGLKLDPDEPGLHLLAAQCERREGDLDSAISRLEKLDVPGLGARVAIDIEYELGQLHDRQNDAVAAFEHFSKANQLSADFPLHQAVDKHKFSTLIESTCALLTPEWRQSWREAPSAPVARQAPVFMLGFPRSGTTLTQQILASHPALITLDEKPTIDAVLARVPGYPNALANLGADKIASLRETYFDAVATYIDADTSSGRVIDKMPLNIAYVPLIMRLFPEAQIILNVRHPMDACLSCFMQNFIINSAMANFFTLEDAAALYAKTMGLWQTCVQVLEPNYHVVCYEQLVGDFDTETRNLLDFVGVDWDPAVHDYAEHAKNSGRIFTPSYQQVTEPIYERARYRWQRYADDLKQIEPILKPFADHFGY